MYKLSEVELKLLIDEEKAINDNIIMYEDDLKEYRSGTNRFIEIDDIHLIEEQLHYMRGYHRLLKIRLCQQGIKM